MTAKLCTLILQRKWEQAVQHLNLWPQDASHYAYHTLRSGTSILCLPIHLACMRKPPMEVITALITAPTIVQNTSTSTLHQNPLLVRNYFSCFDGLQSQQGKDTLLVKDSMGRCALHLACRYNASSEVLNLLISSCPSSVFIRADDGSLPIHLLCLYAKSYSNTIITLKYLLLVMPSSVHMRDDNDLLPKDLVEDNPNVIVREGMKKILFEAEYGGARSRSSVTESSSWADEYLISDSFNTHSSFIPFRSSHSGVSLAEVQLDHESRSTEPSSWTELDHDSTTFVNNPNFIPSSNYSSNSSSSASVSSQSGGSTKAATTVKTKKCIICLSNEACRVLLPCGHISLCEDCTTPTSLKKMGQKCPECRSNINGVITVYARILADE